MSDSVKSKTGSDLYYKSEWDEHLLRTHRKCTWTGSQLNTTEISQVYLIALDLYDLEAKH